MGRRRYMDQWSSDQLRTRLLEGADPPAGVADGVGRSWQRCRALGLRPGRSGTDAMLEQSALERIRQRNERLIAFAQPELANLHQQIAGTNSAVLLTDAEGIILQRQGDPAFNRRSQRVALQPGACWGEAARGTNAIGVALAEGHASSVHGAEHFLESNTFLTCAATPIRDAAGRIIGLLDVSGDQPARQLHGLGLVRMGARMIENRILEAEYPEAVYLHFHARPELIGTLGEAILVLDENGRALAANEVAKAHFPQLVPGDAFESLFDATLDRITTFNNDRVVLHTFQGINVTAIIRWPGPTTRVSRSVATQASNPPSDDPCPTLHAGDPDFVARMQRASRVFNSGIPVLLKGETGTGKEQVARMLHERSDRGDGPLVSVNCAAIPESLAEAELFGYRPGAFTGASPEGASGYVLNADGGTLFLDEIGDMPIALQSRLLRVLQDRCVVPVGSTRPIPVDFALVSATHQDLRGEMAEGLFRADLYYRLCGLEVVLPALRERADLDGLIDRFITGTDPTAALSPTARECLLAHDWPGNLRELHNVLRTAIALREPGRPINAGDLPPSLHSEANTNPETQNSAKGELRETEERCMIEAIEAHQGNYAAAARALGISRSTLYRRLNKRCRG